MADRSKYPRLTPALVVVVVEDSEAEVVEEAVVLEAEVVEEDIEEEVGNSVALSLFTF